MYLDFILDIAKVGDIINITTKEQNIEGEIMKISSSLIAVRKANGSVVVCKDEDITDLKLNASNINNSSKESIKSATKIPKGYKEIEKQLNELIRNGEHTTAISTIDEILEKSFVDNKYKSSLLLRKAQAYSSITDYKNAQLSYSALIEFIESVGGKLCI